MSPVNDNLAFGIDISRYNTSPDGKTKPDFDIIAAHQPDKIKQLLRDFDKFSQYGSGLTLREYQREPAIAIIDSIIKKKRPLLCCYFPPSVREK